MNLVLVSQEYPPETAHGGIASQTRLKAQGLARLGHEVTVLSHSTDGRPRESADGPVRVLRIPGFHDQLQINAEEVRWLTYSAQAAAQLERLNAQKPVDLIDFVEWGAEGFVYLLNRAAWNRVPCVVHIQGPLAMLSRTIGWPEPETNFFRVGSWMEGTCLRLADALYSSSAYSADWCRNSYALPHAQIPVIHAGVDTGVFSPRPEARSERPTVIFVGRIAESKGALTLLRAALKLAGRMPDLRLQMIGRGDRRLIERMTVLAQEHGRPGLLDLPGFVPNERLPEYLTRAHVFAAPSQCEGGPGFVYLEAMACGLPAIGCSGSGVAEIIQPGQNGFLTPPDDADALAGALGDVLEDPARRQALSENALRFVAEEADTAVCVKRIESFYRGVLEKEKQAVAPS